VTKILNPAREAEAGDFLAGRGISAFEFLQDFRGERVAIL
jgi:hypothetical protein